MKRQALVDLMQANWINDLKIALVNEDIEKLALLYAETPSTFEDIGSAKEAAALMAGVIAMLKTKREQIQVELDQLKKSIVYQQNQINENRPRLDLTN